MPPAHRPTPSTARVGAVVMVAGFVYVLATHASNLGCLLGVALMLAGALAVAIASDRRELPGQRTPHNGDEPRQRDSVVSAQDAVGTQDEEPTSTAGHARTAASADGRVGASASADDQVGASAEG